ncbi:hypothetical protein RhiirB3_384830 [Rhizophagus irregularis]|nr:hypothetical protein RhiirB3_384830 [Rhizophagus irregularis]
MRLSDRHQITTIWYPTRDDMTLSPPSLSSFPSPFVLPFLFYFFFHTFLPPLFVGSTFQSVIRNETHLSNAQDLGMNRHPVLFALNFGCIDIGKLSFLYPETIGTILTISSFVYFVGLFDFWVALIQLLILFSLGSGQILKYEKYDC